MSSGLVQPSAFDSDLFGVRFGRIRAEAAAIVAAGAPAIMAELGGFDYVDCRIGADARAALAVLVAAGMVPVEGVVLFDRGAAGPPAALRDASAADIGALRPLVLDLAATSRFSRAPVLGPDAGPRLYQCWLERSLSGEAAHAVLVAERAGRPAGLVTLAHAGPDADELVLFGVAAEARGQGVADDLVAGAAARARAAGRTRLLIKTGLDNIAAQRAYQRCGFRTRSAFWVLEHVRQES